MNHPEGPQDAPGSNAGLERPLSQGRLGTLESEATGRLGGEDGAPSPSARQPRVAFKLADPPVPDGIWVLTLPREFEHAESLQHGCPYELRKTGERTFELVRA